MYSKERTEFGTLSLSSDSTVSDDLLDELCRSAKIDRREPVGRPAASLHSWRRAVRRKFSASLCPSFLSKAIIIRIAITPVR